MDQSLATIYDLCEKQNMTPIPMGHRSLEFEGQKLGILQCEVLAAAYIFVSSGGRLTPFRVETLRTFDSILSKAIPTLSTEGQKHFKGVKHIGEIVLKKCN